MTNNLKGGQELLDEFFEEVTKMIEVDGDTARVLAGLYREGKLTPTNISNELSALRESIDGDQTDEN